MLLLTSLRITNAHSAKHILHNSVMIQSIVMHTWNTYLFGKMDKYLILGNDPDQKWYADKTWTRIFQLQCNSWFVAIKFGYKMQHFFLDPLLPLSSTIVNAKVCFFSMARSCWNSSVIFSLSFALVSMNPVPHLDANFSPTSLLTSRR